MTMATGPRPPLRIRGHRSYNTWAERRRGWRGTVAVWEVGTGVVATLMRLSVEAGRCVWTPTGDGLRIHGSRHVFAVTFVTGGPAVSTFVAMRAPAPPVPQDGFDLCGRRPRGAHVKINYPFT
ncbi:hypothetical protein [Actinoplanes subtropicus]|uniref:hypothetical protein n=1 Tax=Actinoplanes subtropicus TaxID=543632 RepID=UPI0004C40B17|nr:hypothetical protein [Actinoplanes subtropicus]